MAKKRGRPTKLTPELIAQLEEHLTLGLSRSRACILAGITEDTLANWCKADPELALLLQQAEVKGELEHLKNIRAIAMGQTRGDFRASAWFLSRKYPAQWGEQSQEVSNNKEVSAQLTSDQRTARIIELKKKLAQDSAQQNKLEQLRQEREVSNTKVKT